MSNMWSNKLTAKIRGLASALLVVPVFLFPVVRSFPHVLDPVQSVFIGMSIDSEVLNDRQTHEREIDSYLAGQGNARVIVWLKNNAFTAPSYQDNIEKKKNEIHAIQQSVISKLTTARILYQFESVNGFAAEIDQEDFNALREDENVEMVFLDREVQAELAQSRPLIRADIAEYTLGYDGSGATVCVVDSGINYNHASLSAAYVGGYDFVNNDPDPFDDNGHGTRVAGIVASRDGTYRGIAPGVAIAAVKVLGANGFGSLASMSAGIDWCVTHQSVLAISVILLSLSDYGQYSESSCPSYANPSILSASYSRIFIAAASGNQGYTSGISYPACNAQVASVGASYKTTIGAMTWNWYYPFSGSCTDTNAVVDSLVCVTNRASNLDLVAPGAGVTAPTLGGGFGSASGTSYAAPHAAGVAALLLDANRNLLPQQIERLLKNSHVFVPDSATGASFPRIDALDSIHSLPSLSLVGTPAIGTNAFFNISDPLHPNSEYIIVLAGATSPGIVLADGRTIPVSVSDPLFNFSLYNPDIVGFNAFGATDAQGNALIPWNIPTVPLSGARVYAVFITYNSSTSEIHSISNPLEIAFQ